MAPQETTRNWNIAVIVCLIIAVLGIVTWRARPIPLTIDKAYTPGTIAYDIANEQLQYAWLWTNWTATDWLLTLLAAGTAIGAAVKNAFSAHNQVQAQAAAAANNPPPEASTPATNGIDKWVMVLAAMTIIATTLESKMHAGVQADRYRRGDLKLQEALLDYKVSKDQVPLVAAWHRAQRILEGLEETPEPAPAMPLRSSGESPPLSPIAKGTPAASPTSTSVKTESRGEKPVPDLPQ